MFEKQDYLEYFKKIEDIEIEMAGRAKRLLDNVQDKDVKKMLQKILNDEKRHAKIAESIIDLIK